MKQNEKINKKDVAIVVPLSFKDEFTESENISLRHLEHFLGDYTKYFLIPRKRNFSYPGFKIKKLPNRYFGSAQAHNFLLGSKFFYQQFEKYRYIFIYHLDSLVFSDRLLYWCRMGYDFIAAPWINGPDLPWLKEEGVGNGGFNIRKVDGFLNYLNSNVHWIDPEEYWEKTKTTKTGIERTIRFLKKILLKCRSRNNVNHHIQYYISQNKNEDLFWQLYKNKYYPDFNIAPVDVALGFGFEANVKKCYERNNYQLPFGCHAWEKYDKEFWKPYLLTDLKQESIQSNI